MYMDHVHTHVHMYALNKSPGTCVCPYMHETACWTGGGGAAVLLLAAVIHSNCAVHGLQYIETVWPQDKSKMPHTPSGSPGQVSSWFHFHTS